MSLVEGLADYLVGVQAGFDTEALRPPATVSAELARLKAQPHAVRALTQWCLSGAVPRLRHRMTVGALRAASGGDAVALQGVSKFVMRVKCAMLAWVALEADLRQIEAERG